MPAPVSYTYSVAAKIAARTAFRTLLDTATGTVTLKLRSALDVLLATYTLDDPCATINGTTGVMDFDFVATTVNAAATGNVAYGEFCDGAGVAHLSLPAQTGGAAAAGYITMNTLEAVSGEPIAIISARIG